MAQEECTRWCPRSWLRLRSLCEPHALEPLHVRLGVRIGQKSREVRVNIGVGFNFTHFLYGVFSLVASPMNVGLGHRPRTSSLAYPTQTLFVNADSSAQPQVPATRPGETTS